MNESDVHNGSGVPSSTLKTTVWRTLLLIVLYLISVVFAIAMLSTHLNYSFNTAKLIITATSQAVAMLALFFGAALFRWRRGSPSMYVFLSIFGVTPLIILTLHIGRFYNLPFNIYALLPVAVIMLLLFCAGLGGFAATRFKIGFHAPLLAIVFIWLAYRLAASFYSAALYALSFNNSLDPINGGSYAVYQMAMTAAQSDAQHMLTLCFVLAFFIGISIPKEQHQWNTFIAIYSAITVALVYGYMLTDDQIIYFKDYIIVLTQSGGLQWAIAFITFCIVYAVATIAGRIGVLANGYIEWLINRKRCC